jgi:uncharacterized protein YgiM (DUF1202 family)
MTQPIKWPFLCLRVLICLSLFLAVHCAGPREIEKIPSVQKKEDLFVVTTDRINLRACPGTDCRIETGLKRGEEIIKIRKEGEWLKVRVKTSGLEGWIPLRFVSKPPPPRGLTSQGGDVSTRPREEWAIPEK